MTGTCATGASKMSTRPGSEPHRFFAIFHGFIILIDVGVDFLAQYSIKSIKASKSYKSVDWQNQQTSFLLYFSFPLNPLLLLWTYYAIAYYTLPEEGLRRVVPSNISP